MFSKIILLNLLCLGSLAWAKESAPEHAAGQPAEGPGGLKSEAKVYSGRQNEEWMKIQKDLTTSKVKLDKEVSSLTELQKSLSHRSGSVSDEEQAQITALQKKIKEYEQDYKNLYQQYRLRFPEKGLELGRKYQREERFNTRGFVDAEEKASQIDSEDKKINDLSQKLKYQYLYPSSNQALSEKKTILRREYPASATVKTNRPSVTDKIDLKK